MLKIAFCICGCASLAAAQTSQEKLEQRYQSELDKLRDQITRQLPKIEDEAGVNAFIASEKLDRVLLKGTILADGTPKALAEFASESREYEQLIERLLADSKLMKQMLIADGARITREGSAYYGPSMRAYAKILGASKRTAEEGLLQRLAVAIALEWPSRDDGKGKDPVKRYLHFEKAYLDGELDAGFPTHDIWNLRLVVNGNEQDWEMAWARKTLRNFRPDHVYTENRGKRYSGVVSSNVHYGSTRQQFDRPELSGYQNILMNGGICGRRAFFGQFICRSFGVPSIKRPSKAHGAMARWSPKGWVVNLGPGWGSGRTDTLYSRDRAFLESSQARRNPQAYVQAARAQWVGELLGENRMYGAKQIKSPPSTWNDVSIRKQKQIIKESKFITLAPEGAKFGEKDDLTITEQLMASEIREDDRNIIVGNDGTIIIPAAAHINPEGKKLNRFDLMKSFDGGLQAYFSPFNRKGVNVLRGGSQTSGAENCTSSRRIKGGRMGRYGNWGFRVAATLKAGNPPPRELELDLGNGVTLELVYINPGSFIMGGDRTSKGNFDCPETPKHPVEITKGYYIGKYEVTASQYQVLKEPEKVATMKNPKHPAGLISIDEAEWFCKKASEKTGCQVRLPTEAEWEYAARAGTATPRFFGKDESKLPEYAWFNANSNKKLQAVGQKKPNPWGLYDVYGNVWERVSDSYDEGYYANSPKTDPAGPEQLDQSHVQYAIQLPAAGHYALSARVVTMNYDQMLQVATDGGAPSRMAMPFTLGAWKDSEPVVIELQKGRNVLTFSRAEAPQFGMAVKFFTLKPTR